MAKVKQHPYLSTEAIALRRRDGIPPWGVHVCEVDSLAHLPDDGSIFARALADARALRDEIESVGR